MHIYNKIMQNILQNFKSGVQGGPPLHEENFVGCSAYPFCGQFNLNFAIEYVIFDCRKRVGGGYPPHLLRSVYLFNKKLLTKP